MVAKPVAGDLMGEAQPTERAAPPARPPGAAEIAAMMAAAEAAAEERNLAAPPPALATPASPMFQRVLVVLIWSGLSIFLAASAYVVLSGAFGQSGILLAAIIAAIGLALLAAALRGSFVLRAPAALKLSPAAAPEDAQLAGGEMLTSMAIAERVLDADPDPRLITRRDGVVVFANSGYFRLAREAGVEGSAGLPPRIDRLFARQGAEASKLFRLCRAAASGDPAEEIVQLQIESASERRRFEITARAVAGAGGYVAWRLRELSGEAGAHDSLAAAYADYTRPVFALEKSGQIAWANAAMRGALGIDQHRLVRIDDIILGETDEIARRLWSADSSPARAAIRRRGAEPVEAVFTAFGHGGVGEGFALVDMAVEEKAASEEEATALSGDVNEAPFGVAVVEGEIGRDALIVETNRTFAEIFSINRKKLPLSRALPAEAIAELAAEARRKAVPGVSPRMVDATIGKGPAGRTFGIYLRPVRRRRGSYGVRRAVLYTVDVTDRKRMEQDHAQDQKLKAIGVIAGEVAHDFNNLLQVIQGNCEQLMLRHPAGDPAYQDLVLIRENAQRAANLTKQLLAYSRKQTLSPRVQSITDILLDFSRFLDRTVGEKVKFELVNGRGLPDVKVDRTQLETAIMNLAVNARDAMAPDGGRLTIRTRHVAAAEAAALNIAGLAAQDYVLIEAADTGPGVAPEIADRIFDPFFTTKEEGKGTGLGLSTVQGIIGQMEGAITVSNAPAGGAVFNIYLPAHQGEAEEEETRAGPAFPTADYSGSGRILVIEDEDPVRAIVVATLERSGYEVAAAADGEEALALLEEDRDFDLIVTDVMMPEVDGPTLVRRARSELGVRSAVIFMSGYAEGTVRAQMDAVGGASYIQKPFAIAELGEKVKSALRDSA